MDDLISRQAAIEALKRAEALTRAFGYHFIIDTILELPSAERRGRWTYNANFAEPPFKCSACGKSQGRLSKYCPNCGAKMGEGEK